MAGVGRDSSQVHRSPGFITSNLIGKVRHAHADATAIGTSNRSCLRPSRLATPPCRHAYVHPSRERFSASSLSRVRTAAAPHAEQAADGRMIKEYEASHGTVADMWHAHLVRSHPRPQHARCGRMYHMDARAATRHGLGEGRGEAVSRGDEGSVPQPPSTVSTRKSSSRALARGSVARRRLSTRWVWSRRSSER